MTQAGAKGPKIPANDDFEHRAKLGASAKFDNTLATFQEGEPADAAYLGYATSGHSLWWIWTAPVDGEVVISVDCNFTYFLGAYSGSTLSNLTSVQKQFGRPLTIDVAAKTVLQISLDGYTVDVNGQILANGYGSGKVIINYIRRPANDNFANRQMISGGQVVIHGNNTDATQESGELNSPYNTLNHTVWYKWIAPATGYAVIVPETTGSSYPVAGVYTGSTVSNLTTVATSSNPGAALGFSTVAGEMYCIALDEAFGGEGAFSWTLSLSTIHLTSPEDGALFYEGDPIRIVAAASASDGNGTTIDYYAGNQLLGSGPRNAHSGVVWKNARLGDYSLRAIITDTHKVARISGPVNIRVRPINDDFTNAFVLVGLNVTTNGMNTGAGKEVGEPTGGDVNADASVWYTWTAPASGEVWVSIGEKSFWGHPLGVYTGDSVSNLVALSESTDSISPCHFVAHAGDKIYIEVSGFSQEIPDGFGPFTLIIDQQVEAPTNQAVIGNSEGPLVGQIQRASPSRFTFTFTGKRGTTYTVLTSTNLFSPISEWQTILTTNLWDNSATIQDDIASGAQRYYRVKVGP